jgi:rubrerythrin
MRNKKIVFDGNLGWICPKCGVINEWISADVTAYGQAKRTGFYLMGEKMELTNYEEDLDFDDYVFDNFSCPECGHPVTAKEVREGLFKWLEYIKRENPEWYAEVMADLVEPP